MPTGEAENLVAARCTRLYLTQWGAEVMGDFWRASGLQSTSEGQGSWAPLAAMIAIAVIAWTWAAAWSNHAPRSSACPSLHQGCYQRCCSHSCCSHWRCSHCSHFFLGHPSRKHPEVCSIADSRASQVDTSRLTTIDVFMQEWMLGRALSLFSLQRLTIDRAPWTSALHCQELIRKTE